MWTPLMIFPLGRETRMGFPDCQNGPGKISGGHLLNKLIALSI
jgi:hypothetical protein